MAIFGGPAGTVGHLNTPSPSLPDTVLFEDDFTDNLDVSATVGAARYAILNGAGTGVTTGLVLEHGGACKLSTAASPSANDNSAIRAVSFVQTSAAGRTVEFFARMKVDSGSDTNFFIGLQEVSGTTNGNVLGRTTKSGIGFYTSQAAAGTATITCSVGDGTNQSNTAVTTGSYLVAADDTYLELGCRIINRSVAQFWINGGVNGAPNVTVKLDGSTSYAPTAVLALIAQIKCLATTQRSITIDHWRVNAGR